MFGRRFLAQAEDIVCTRVHRGVIAVPSSGEQIRKPRGDGDISENLREPCERMTGSGTAVCPISVGITVWVGLGDAQIVHGQIGQDKRCDNEKP